MTPDWHGMESLSPSTVLLQVLATNSSHPHHDTIPFVFRPEFIVPVVIVFFVFISCITLFAYRIATRRRGEGDLSVLRPSEQPVWFRGILDRFSTRKSEELLPLNQTPQHERSRSLEREEQGFLSNFSTIFNKKEGEGRMNAELLFQAKMFLRTTSYELMEKKDLLPFLKSKKTHTRNTAHKTFVFCENQSGRRKEYGVVVSTDCSGQSLNILSDINNQRAFYQFMLHSPNLSPYFVNVIHVDYLAGKCFTLIPYLPNGSLFDLLEETKKEHPNVTSFMDPDTVSQISGQILCALKALSLLGLQFTHLSSRNILIDKVTHESSGTQYSIKLSGLEEQFLLFNKNTFQNLAKNSVESFGYILFELCTGTQPRHVNEIYQERILNASFRKIIQQIFPNSVGTPTDNPSSLSSSSMVTLDSLLEEECFYCDPEVLTHLKNQEVVSNKLQ